MPFTTLPLQVFFISFAIQNEASTSVKSWFCLSSFFFTLKATDSRARATPKIYRRQLALLLTRAVIDTVSHHCHISDVIKITSSDLSLCVSRTLTFASRCMLLRRTMQKTRTSLNHYFNICRMRRQKFDL